MSACASAVVIRPTLSNRKFPTHNPKLPSFRHTLSGRDQNSSDLTDPLTQRCECMEELELSEEPERSENVPRCGSGLTLA